MLITDEMPERWSMDRACRELTLGTAKLFNQIDRLEREVARLERRIAELTND